MFRKFLIFIMLIFVLIGLSMGIYFSVFSNKKNDVQNSQVDSIFDMVQTKEVAVSEFFTYGRSLNFSGTIDNVSKSNFESVKLYITDGKGFENTYPLDGNFDGDKLFITTRERINDEIILDELQNGEYVIFVRLKLNNSVNAKFYSLSNVSGYPNIEYNSITKENKNKKINLNFKTQKYKEHDYNYLSIAVETVENLNNVCDIVIDAGHGGKDVGEKSGADTEANISLEYAKLLKQRLESNGLRVRLTRDDANSEQFTSTNMYDDNGRIALACVTKAKYMISFHINNGNKGLRGLEIYSPSKSNLTFAQNMANNIVANTDLEYSNNNSFKQGEGVYVRNFTTNVIDEYRATAEKKGYEPYNLTLDTPYLYTIREVGGIATNAYVDGRNKAYSANKYWKSNQGIECYQIEMGYIKNDLEIIKNQMEQYVNAISQSILEKLNV